MGVSEFIYLLWPDGSEVGGLAATEDLRGHV